MLLGMHSSPIRSRFSFPIWPKKKEVIKEQKVEKLKKTDIIKKQVEKVDLSKWL